MNNESIFTNEEKIIFLNAMANASDYAETPIAREHVNKLTTRIMEVIMHHGVKT